MYRDLVNADSTLREELLDRTWTSLKDSKDDSEIEYYIEIIEVLKEFIEPQEAWNMFREKHDITKKDVVQVVRKLVR